MNTGAKAKTVIGILSLLGALINVGLKIVKGEGITNTDIQLLLAAIAPSAWSFTGDRTLEKVQKP